MFDPLKPDIFYAEIVVTTAQSAETARADLRQFLISQDPLFASSTEPMLPHAASQTGQAPATHYICARHTHQRELDAFEAEQKARAAAGKPLIPISYYLSQPFIPDGQTRSFIAAHEAKVLADLGLRRIA